MNRFTFFLSLAFAFFQCQNHEPKQAAPPTSTEIQPGKYNVTFTGQMVIEKVGGVTPPDTVIIPPPPPPIPAIGQFFVGVNTNNYQDKTKQIGFNGTRLYLPIGWVYTEKGMYAQPQLQGQKQFLGIDDYLAYMKSKGVDVLLCLMDSPDWLNGHTKGWITNDWPAIKPGLDKSKPESWKDVAEIYRAFAIRYGSKVHPKGSYKVDPAPPRWTGDLPQQELSGLNLVKWIEVGNELDLWWDREKYLEPEHHAAMLLQCYDAIKSADPNMGVSMAGLTNVDVPYLERMNAYFKSKGREFLSDCISVHRYSNAGNNPGVHPPTWFANQATSVEQDPGISDFAKVMAFAKSVNRPVWVGECGYDSQPGSQMSPAPQSGKTLEQIQAEWLPRAALEYTRMGAARTYIFTIADEPNPNAGLFTSCGVLFGENQGYREKPAYAALADLVSTLSGMIFVKDESTATTRIMRFEDEKRKVWAYWSPTSTGASFGGSAGGWPVSVTETAQYLIEPKK